MFCRVAAGSNRNKDARFGHLFSRKTPKSCIRLLLQPGSRFAAKLALKR